MRRVEGREGEGRGGGGGMEKIVLVHWNCLNYKQALFNLRNK